MDKKSIAVVVVLGVILIGIVIATFVYDAKINTSIVEINGVKYSKDDFESYLKVWQYENGEEPVDMDTMFSNYQVYKLYSQYVDKYKIELPSGEQIEALTEEDKTKLQNDYALAENEYRRVKTEIAKVDYLYSNLPSYWKVSDEDYEEHKGENADKFKMYDYRVMQVAVESAPETSGDVSGDVSGDNGEQARKDAAMAKAVEALAKVKSGDSFEEVAKEYGTNRITYTNGGYTIVNGSLETVSGLYMEDYLWDENIIKALQTLNKGEYSEIFENENSYTFVYLEDVREGLDKADDDIYRRQIANEHIQGEARIAPPNAIVLKSIDLKKLIPILAKTGEESGETLDKNNENNNVVENLGDENISENVELEVSGE